MVLYGLRHLYAGKVMSFFEKPIEVTVLEDHIITWEKIDGTILLTPKSHLHFNKLFIRSHYVFMDKLFEFSGVTELITGKKLDKDAKSLFRSLIGLGCELSWSGFLLKKPHFKEYSVLGILKEHVPDMMMNDKLVKALNASDSVMQAVRKVRPDELYVALSCFTQAPSPEASSKFEAPIKHLVKYYHDPKEVVWVVNLNKLISRSIGYKKAFVNILMLVDAVSQVALETSRSFQGGA